MKRIEEIEQRLSAIKQEIDAEGADINALTEETDALIEERKAIVEAEEKRQALLANIANVPEAITTTVEGTVNMEENRTFGIDSEEYRSAWAHMLQGKKLTEVEERAYATSDDHNAVPTAVSEKFFEKMKKLAPMLSEITLMRVAGNLKFMAEGTRTEASLHTENTAVAPAADTMVSVTLGGEEFMKVIRISQSAKVMSVNAFEDWLVEMLAGDIARAIDSYIINNATHGITAMVSTATTNVITQTATSGYGYADIMDLIALLPAAYDAEAKFLVNKATLFKDIKGILDSNNRPIFDPVDKTLCGYPVLVDDYVPKNKKQVFLGRWTDVVGNLSQDIEVARSTESGFLHNSIDFRGTAIFDSALAKTDGIVWLKNS